MHPLLLLLGLSFLGKQAAIVGGRRGGRKPAVIGGDTTAFLYQLPADGYTTTRLAVASGGDDPQEMGIFDSPARALAVAQAGGMTVLHGGQVLQLKSKPGA